MVVGWSAMGWLVLTPIKLGYGRLSNSLANAYVNPKLAWFIAEISNLAWAFYFIFVLGDTFTLPYILFLVHYFNRTIIYPLRMKSETKFPVEVMMSAFSFTFANGFLQGTANQQYTGQPLWRSVLGVLVFAFGMWVNIHSDNICQAAK